VGVEPTMADLQSAALATWLRSPFQMSFLVKMVHSVNTTLRIVYACVGQLRHRMSVCINANFRVTRTGSFGSDKRFTCIFAIFRAANTVRLAGESASSVEPLKFDRNRAGNSDAAANAISHNSSDLNSPCGSSLFDLVAYPLIGPSTNSHSCFHLAPFVLRRADVVWSSTLG
jgi:hypothetical protein